MFLRPIKKTMERRLLLLSPLPVRERMKVRVLTQRAILRANQDSASAPSAFPSPFPVRERMKVRVLTQRAILRANRDSASAASAFLSPLPVRERIKVRVLMQRASSARDSGSRSFSRRLRASKEFVDHTKDLFHTLKHLAIPESKHSITLRLEERGADVICSRSLEMLRPIKLDDEPSLSRAKNQ